MAFFYNPFLYIGYHLEKEHQVQVDRSHHRWREREERQKEEKGLG